jgi:MscS family membrane protein
MRRINFTLGVTYGTSKEQLRSCVNKIQEMLIEYEDINNETILVNFDSFGDSSLNIFIYCFTNTTDWAEYLKVKEIIKLQNNGYTRQRRGFSSFSKYKCIF